MNNTFVSDVIKTLSPQEVEGFRLFLTSAYFVKSSNSVELSGLFNALHKACQDQTFENLSRDDLFSQIFPGKKLVASKIDKLNSELRKHLETFLLVQRLISPNQQRQFDLELIRELRTRNLNQRYEQAFQHLQWQVNAAVHSGIEQDYFQHLLALERHEWESTYNKGDTELHIPQAIFSLENYYFAQKTALLSRFALQKLNAQKPFEPEPGSHSDWFIPDELAAQHPGLTISGAIYRHLKNDAISSDDIRNLINLLAENEHRLSKEMLSEYYTYLRNFCSLLINRGHSEIYQVLHDLQKDNLARGYFYFNGQISPYALLNITQVALLVGQTDWVHDFLDRHQMKIIGGNESQEFYRITKAMCYFEEKKFEQGLEILPHGSSYTGYHLIARRLELKIYHALQSDLFDYKVDAFKMFLSRAGKKDLPAGIQQLNVNFANFLRQINALNGMSHPDRAELIKKKIATKDKVVERSWLLEQVGQLIKRRQ